MTLFRLFTLGLLLISSAAHAGFEWVPPAPNPTAPVIKSKTEEAPPLDEDKAAAHKSEQTSKNASDILSEEEMVNRIFDYETGRVTAEKQQAERDKRINLIKKFHDKIRKKEQEKADAKRAQDAEVSHAAFGLTPLHSPKEPLQNTSVKSAKTLQQLPINPREKPVIGFGAKVPLALAVNDIIPDAYSFSFQDGVNPGTLISWEGLHRPWSIVLDEALSSIHLTAHIQSNRITILPDPARLRRLPLPILQAPASAPNFALQINPAPLSVPIQNRHGAGNLSPFVKAPTITESTSLIAPIPANVNAANANFASGGLPSPIAAPLRISPNPLGLALDQPQPPSNSAPAVKGTYISREESLRQASNKKPKALFFNPLTSLKRMLNGDLDAPAKPHIAVPPTQSKL